MTATVWVDVVLAIPFLIAFIVVPLWMTFRMPQTGPDRAEAHAYLTATAALATAHRGPAADHARDAGWPAAAAA
jgi:hypothetical protein